MWRWGAWGSGAGVRVHGGYRAAAVAGLALRGRGGGEGMRASRREAGRKVRGAGTAAAGGAGRRKGRGLRLCAREREGARSPWCLPGVGRRVARTRCECVCECVRCRRACQSDPYRCPRRAAARGSHLASIPARCLPLAAAPACPLTHTHTQQQQRRQEGGMPLQSTRSGSPSFGGEACKEAARTAQAGPAQQRHTRSSCHGSILSGTGAKMYQQPQLQPGIAVEWDTIPAATHSAGQSLAEEWECARGCRDRM